MALSATMTIVAPARATSLGDYLKAIRRGVRSYTPDFEIVNADGTIEYHEVKGWDYARGQTARKRMAKYHPGVKLVLVDAEAYRALAKWRRVIPGWE